MESNDNLKEIDIKNHAWCYFNDVINGIDINFSDIGLWHFIQNFNGSKTIAY